MDSLLIVLASAAAAVSGWTILRFLTGQWFIRRPTLVGVAFLGIVLTHWMPSVYFLNDPALPQALRFHLACSLALVSLAVGAALANMVSRLTPSEVGSAYDESISSIPTASDRRLVFVLGTFCTLLFLIYLTEVPQWPFFQLVTGGSPTAELNALRRVVLGPEMGSSLWYLYGMARSTFMPILLILAFLIYPHATRRMHRVILVLFVVVALAFNSWSAAKTPVVLLFVVLAIGALIQHPPKLARKRTRRELRRRRRLRLVAISCLAVIVVYPLFVFSLKAFGAGRPFLEVFYDGIVERIFETPAFLSYSQFELFPNSVPHTQFNDIRLWAVLMDRPYVDLSDITARMIRNNPESNAPPASIGNFYAQGGFAIVAIGFLVVGALLQSLQVWVVRRMPRSLLSVGFIAFMCWTSFRLSMTSFHSVILGEGALVALVLASLWRASRKGTSQTRQARAPNAIAKSAQA